MSSAGNRSGPTNLYNQDKWKIGAQGQSEGGLARSHPVSNHETLALTDTRFLTLLLQRGQTSTPACAGQTPECSLARSLLNLNPHARGADQNISQRRRWTVPQPPRTWGRRCWLSLAWLPLPSTPTHVGQTWRGSTTGRWRPLNPHARGADPPRTDTAGHAQPQPPRTWGRLYVLTF